MSRSSTIFDAAAGSDPRSGDRSSAIPTHHDGPRAGNDAVCVQCVTCGYVLHQASAGARCPECGGSVQSSIANAGLRLPDRGVSIFLNGQLAVLALLALTNLAVLAGGLHPGEARFMAGLWGTSLAVHALAVPFTFLEWTMRRGPAVLWQRMLIGVGVSLVGAGIDLAIL